MSAVCNRSTRILLPCVPGLGLQTDIPQALAVGASASAAVPVRDVDPFAFIVLDLGVIVILSDRPACEPPAGWPGRPY